MKLGTVSLQTDTLALHFRALSNHAVIDFTVRGTEWFTAPLTIIMPRSEGERAARAVAAFNAIMSEPDAKPLEAAE